MTEIRPVASDIHLAGGNVSISMLGEWWACPRVWYWKYLHPWPGRTERGIEELYTKDYLLIAGGVHSGLAAYYLSGWKDGNYSLDAAMEACRAHLDARMEEAESEEKFNASLAESEKMLRGYYNEYGPESKSPEYPDTRVAVGKNGEPLVETTFSVPLHTGHILTVRPDLIAYHFGQLVAWDHKTPSAQRASATVGEARLGGQGLAQDAILRQFDMPNNSQLINILVRGPVRATKPFQRHSVPHDRSAVDQMLQIAGNTVLDIQAAVGKWNTLVEDGFSPVEAARVCFPMVGTLSGRCIGKFGPCTAFPICTQSGREDRELAANFRVRTYKQDIPNTNDTESQ